MIARHLTPRLRRALADTPVVFLHGARQTGKSTLARQLAEERRGTQYLTLDDAGVVAAATLDPGGFVAGLDAPVVLDEVQKAPGLFPAIKREVDRRRRPGRFLLTGSANVLLVPRVSESLAGRVELQTLWPFSQGELDGAPERFVDALFTAANPKAPSQAVTAADIFERILRGGYPEVCASRAKSRRRDWFESYVTTILQRDIRDLANIEGLTELPRLLSLVAARAGAILNQAGLARDLSMPQTTLKRYLALLETVFLVRLSPAWSVNVGKRLVKSPRLYLNDTGLLSHLLKLTKDRLARDPKLTGRLVENFVVMELVKQASWSRSRPEMFHFRTHGGQEVDVVLEDSAGRIVGLEIKAGVSLGSGDVKGLHALAELAGDRFHRGIILYLGQDVIPFGARLHAVPISVLWSGL